MGQALAFGKRTSRSDPAYHKWLKENGLDGIPRSCRTHAIWFARNIKTLGEIPDGLAHPATIRQWARKREIASRVPADTVPAAELVPSAPPRVPEPPPPSEAPGAALGQQVTANLADMQQVADLMLEASIHMLRSMDLIREVTQVLKSTNNGG